MKTSLPSLSVCLILLSGSFQLSTGSGGSSAVAVSREVYLMGTRAALTIFAPDRQSGLDQLEGFVSVLEDTEQELSTWREDSPISRLNRQPIGSPFRLSPSLCGLFGKLRIWNRRTGGAFEPAIGPLIKAWGIHSGGRRPTQPELREALEKVGSQHLRFEPHSCVLIRERETWIDVGSFGKGYALDRVLDYAVRKGLERWLIDLGGQIIVRGTPPETERWSVGLADPVRREASRFRVELSVGSLATSGGSERDMRAGEDRIGHVLDPRTGDSVRADFAVTVWNQRALDADILSTALYVMGIDEGLAWAEANDIAACFLIPAEGGHVEQRVTSRFNALFGTP